MNRRKRNKLRAAGEPYSKGFNVKRGRDYFVASLVIMPVVVGLQAWNAESFSVIGAIALVIGFSVLSGIVGTFWDNVGL